jgi:hypothetical protein
MVLAAALMIVAIAALGLVLVWRSSDQERLASVALKNCLAIENLKAIVRPDPFDALEVRRILADLNIDPDSEHAQRLIENARRDNARERRELAPHTC